MCGRGFPPQLAIDRWVRKLKHAHLLVVVQSSPAGEDEILIKMKPVIMREVEGGNHFKEVIVDITRGRA